MLRSSSLLWVIWLLVVWVGFAVDAPAQGWVDRTGPNGPGALQNPAMCYDPVRGYVLLVGGRLNPNTGQSTGETWSWNGTAWTLRGPAPDFVGGNAMAVHASTNEVFVAGILNLQLSVSVFRWDGAGWALVASGLSSNLVCGLPNVRLSFACDPTRNQTILFHTFTPTKVLSYNGTSWSTQIATSSPNMAPNVLCVSSVAMAFDPATSKIIMVFCLPAFSSFPFCFEWNGFGWNQRLPTLLPARGMAAMATDSARNRVVGLDADHLSQLPNHTWAYANGVFTQLATPVEPSLRSQSAMAYDPARGVHVLFGGGFDFGFGSLNWFADTWEFDLGPLASFTPYGAGCAGSRGVPQLVAQTNSLPRIGQTFTARTSNLPWTGPALMLVGLSDTSYSGTPLPADLSMLNAPGCFLRTSIDDVQPVQNVLGTALWSFVIPPMPGATFFLQAVPFDPAANPLNLTFSNGGRAVVGL